MTVEEVAVFLRLEPDAVLRLVAEGSIPGGKVGEAWRFQRSEIEMWTARKLAGSAAIPKIHPLSIAHYLAPDRVLLLRNTTKKGALQELIERLTRQTPALHPEELAAQLFHRESLMSTGIGMGVAVPHVRMTSVTDMVVAVGLSQVGLSDYESLDGKSVHLVFMIVAAKTQHAEYLRLLSGITGRLRDAEWLNALLSAADAETLFEALKR